MNSEFTSAKTNVRPENWISEIKDYVYSFDNKNIHSYLKNRSHTRKITKGRLTEKTRGNSTIIVHFYENVSNFWLGARKMKGDRDCMILIKLPPHTQTKKLKIIRAESKAWVYAKYVFKIEAVNIKITWANIRNKFDTKKKLQENGKNETYYYFLAVE